MKITVLGAGSWGTAFSRLTALSGHSTTLWARREKLTRQLIKERENKRYLPGVNLPSQNLNFTSKIGRGIKNSKLVVFAVPSFAMREVSRGAQQYITPSQKYLINLAKGIEQETFSTMSEVLRSTIPDKIIFTLSGPCHAEEVGQDHPTAVILGGDIQSGSTIQRALSTARFRIYLSADIKGIEYCGIVKNIIAIATGISSGLGFGDNATGALISRGLAEMVRFGKFMKTEKDTFFGLAGVGDLVATCTSSHSRNRKVGELLGKGKNMEQISKSMNMVAEGVHSVKIIKRIADENNISMPITQSVWRIIERGENPDSEVERIMSRDFKIENL